ncbi:MAG: hypothetical protein JOY58_09705 [Solirubrobacterales bacterium]|nr:hypothetical protein [Solirubrobacterales bacterium]
MRRTTIYCRSLAAALAPFALAGAILAPGAIAVASLTRPTRPSTVLAGRPKVGVLRGFLIFDYSSCPLKLIHITGDGYFRAPPWWVGD